MNKLGEKLKDLRKSRNLSLKHISSNLDIDQAILSKAERGIKKLSRDQVARLARYFNIPESELIVLWTADKVIYQLGLDNDIALEALKVAEQEVAYSSSKEIDRKSILKKIRTILNKDDRIVKVWIFGSFARKEDNQDSDIDILFQVKDNVKFSLFDQLSIRAQLIEALNRNVDFIENDTLKKNLHDDVIKDLILIHG